MRPDSELAALVRERAANRCEYCLMHQVLQGATFHIEHIIPRSQGGRTEPANLALACPSCNLHKADRRVATDPASNTLVPLFHPRQQGCSEHFRFVGGRIQGTTSIGRATVLVLGFNSLRRQRIRAAEERLGLYPPTIH